MLRGLLQKYDYGESEILPRADFRDKIRALIESLKQYGVVFLIFHDAASDIQCVILADQAMYEAV